ncbi:MAG TPA: hypothetical protein VFZ11_02955, partial [Gemmatimonadaceae bacterium]
MSVERFLEMARGGGLVPVWRDCLLDADTPVSAFAKLRRPPFAFLLESAPAGGETWSRYTFLGTEPRRAWRLRDRVVEWWSPERGWHDAHESADPLEELRAELSRHRPAEVPELGAFWSGAVGYFGYDVVRLLESLPSPPPRALDVPDALFVFTRTVVIVDNLRAQARVVVAVPVEPETGDGELRRLHAAAAAEIDDVMRRLRAPSALAPLELDAAAPPAAGRSSYERARFLADVE